MAIQLILAVSAVMVVLVHGQQQEPPTPYAFEYRNVGDDGGESFHSSSGDGAGRVTGSYGLTDIDGRARRVDYVADEGGFRATVTSNEPGVDGSLGSPADVEVRSPGAPQPAPAPQPIVVAAPPRRVVVRPAAPRRVIVSRPQPVAFAPLGGYGGYSGYGGYGGYRLLPVSAATGGYRVISSPRASPLEYVYVR